MSQDPSIVNFQLDSGNTSWILTTSGLVLLMTLPGLVLYYGGMVRAQNVLAVALQTVSITCLITFMWLSVGYSLSFAPVNATDSYPIIGDSSRMWLLGMDLNSYHSLAPTIPESVFCIRQLTFAIITPALISGSFAFRMRYSSMLIFVALWHVFVYCPLAHVMWHPSGFLHKLGDVDFAGGNVVHLASGTASLVCATVVGNKGFGTDRFEPHNILLTVMGASMLWVGWYAFNAGSADGSAASAQAGFAMLCTQISSSMSALTWMMTESYWHGEPTVLGMVSGAIAGLVVITPGAGYVDTTGAFIMGLVAGPLCYGGVHLKHAFGFEDALDAFGTHAVGGLLGGLLTGLFANADIGGVNGAFYGHGMQFAYQIVGVCVSGGYSLVMTFIILKLVDKTIGLRPVLVCDNEDLDASIHGSIRGSISGTIVEESRSHACDIENRSISSVDNLTVNGNRVIVTNNGSIVIGNGSVSGSVSGSTPGAPATSNRSINTTVN